MGSYLCTVPSGHRSVHTGSWEAGWYGKGRCDMTSTRYTTDTAKEKKTKSSLLKLSVDKKLLLSFLLLVAPGLRLWVSGQKVRGSNLNKDFNPVCSRGCASWQTLNSDPNFPMSWDMKKVLHSAVMYVTKYLLLCVYCAYTRVGCKNTSSERKYSVKFWKAAHPALLRILLNITDLNTELLYFYYLSIRSLVYYVTSIRFTLDIRYITLDLC